MEQRYLVDVTSDAHLTAINNKLSYIEGIVYNDIAYVEEHFGTYITDNHRFLHLTEDEYNLALASLAKKDLIVLYENKASIKKMSFEELSEDPLIAAMMEYVIRHAKLEVKNDPLERYKNDNTQTNLGRD